MSDYRREYDLCRDLVEERLKACFTDVVPQRELLEAMRYSLLAGGKRIRPVLTLKFCEAHCGEMEPALDFACGIEMLHTYSLIHDDLPCMDDDDLRRGKPTCHKVFGECTSVLAGDALQAAAFSAVLTAKGGLRPGSREAAGAVLAAAAGATVGICGGQYLDMAAEGRSITAGELSQIHSRKTAALLKAACVMGLQASSKPVSDAESEAARRYAEALGLAFQIRDDILDATSTTEILGKPVGSDAANGKTTFVSLQGVAACEKLVREKTEEAKDAIRGVFAHTEFLCWLADDLAGREH